MRIRKLMYITFDIFKGIDKIETLLENKKIDKLELSNLLDSIKFMSKYLNDEIYKIREDFYYLENENSQLISENAELKKLIKILINISNYDSRE